MRNSQISVPRPHLLHTCSKKLLIHFIFRFGINFPLILQVQPEESTVLVLLISAAVTMSLHEFGTPVNKSANWSVDKSYKRRRLGGASDGELGEQVSSQQADITQQFVTFVFCLCITELQLNVQSSPPLIPTIPQQFLLSNLKTKTLLKRSEGVQL